MRVYRVTLTNNMGTRAFRECPYSSSKTGSTRRRGVTRRKFSLTVTNSLASFMKQVDNCFTNTTIGNKGSLNVKEIVKGFSLFPSRDNCRNLAKRSFLCKTQNVLILSSCIKPVFIEICCTYTENILGTSLSIQIFILQQKKTFIENFS